MAKSYMTTVVSIHGRKYFNSIDLTTVRSQEDLLEVFDAMKQSFADKQLYTKSLSYQPKPKKMVS